MISGIHRIVVLLAITIMAMATDLPGDPTAVGATVTVTEPACMTGCLGDATPLAIASALATAADVTAAASLVASLMAERQYGGGGGGGASDPRPTEGTRTVTTFASATDCPPKPTFDMSPAGEFAELLLDERVRIAGANNTANATDIGGPNQRNKGPASMCITDSSTSSVGGYGLFIDGWGQEADGCGRGILDNLRGQCWGTIERWKCSHWGSGVKLTFRVPATHAGCVPDAVWLASPHNNREDGLCCSYLGPSVVWSGTHSCDHVP